MGLILMPGTCSSCGCTDAAACPGGCSWADADRTLCSRCASEPELEMSLPPEQLAAMFPLEEGEDLYVVDDPELGGLT